MKFSCTKENLKDGLSVVAHVAGKHINLPILSNVHIKAGESAITLATTDLEIGMITTVRGKVTELGEFTVSAKLLSDYVALLPNERIDIALNGNTLHITCGSYSTKIKGESSEDFPVIPSVEEGVTCTLPLDLWQSAVSEVVFATANNEARVELSGVYVMLSTKSITFAATDSYRLAEKTITGSFTPQEERGVIIPTKTLQELLRFTTTKDATLTYTLGDSQILFKYGETTLISRIIDGHYPDYRQIIPEKNRQKTTVRVNRQELIRAIKAAALFSPAAVNDVHIDFPIAKKSVVVSAVNTQSGESTSEVAAVLDGDDNGVVLNYRYLLDGLLHIPAEDITFTMSDAASPCVFSGSNEDGYLYVIMPIKK
jgi:DNA polymerase-3 subunit beta